LSLIERVIDNIADIRRFGPLFALRHLSFLFGKQVHRASVDGFRIYMRRNSKDAVILRQIFRHGDWDFRKFPQSARVWNSYAAIIGAGECPIIIDAGANVGAASLWFARLFPQASIIAVEPDPSNAEMCRLNTRHVSSISVIEAAIGASPGTAILSNSVGTSISAQTTRSPTGVRIYPVSELLRGRPLLIVKIDIEGFESDLFSPNTEWLDEASMVMVETHDWMFPGQFKSHSLQRSMADRNFEMLLNGENIFYVR
jgi:FkbM family methyltransferase